MKNIFHFIIEIFKARRVEVFQFHVTVNDERYYVLLYATVFDEKRFELLKSHLHNYGFDVLSSETLRIVNLMIKLGEVDYVKLVCKVKRDSPKIIQKNHFEHDFVYDIVKMYHNFNY